MLDKHRSGGRGRRASFGHKALPKEGGIFDVKYCIPSDSTKISRQAENHSLYRYILWREKTISKNKQTR